MREWNSENIIGLRICAYITYLDGEGQIENRLLNHGTICKADSEVIEYVLDGTESEIFAIPAFYDNLQTAEQDIVYAIDENDNRNIKVDIVTTFTVMPKESEFGTS